MPQGWFHSNDALIPGNKHKPKVHWGGVYQSYASGSKGGDTRWFSYFYDDDDDENVNEQSTTRRRRRSSKEKPRLPKKREIWN